MPVGGVGREHDDDGKGQAADDRGDAAEGGAGHLGILWRCGDRIGLCE
jgi:hypothetical protein